MSAINAPIHAIHALTLAGKPLGGGGLSNHLSVQRPNAGGSFGDMLADSIQQTNNVMVNADQQIERMVESQGANLHETIVAIEQADISMRLTLKIGQKLVQAYTEVARIQI